MFEGIYFQFPKLGFLLFFFLACEALCPLRSNPFYFPRIGRFDEVGVKNPLWLWIAKWAMITLLIVAAMSPVRDIRIEREGNGYDILLALDPEVLDQTTVREIGSFMREHPHERLALWIPDDVIIPLTYEHDAVESIVRQVKQSSTKRMGKMQIQRFFSTSREGKKYVILLTNHPKSFADAVPAGIESSIISPAEDKGWALRLTRLYPPSKIQYPHRYFDFYYIYPLFLGFIAMLAYLYGRNQKGLK